MKEVEVSPSVTKCVLRNDSEIIQLNGIGLFTIEVEGDSLEKGEAPEDTFNNDINTNALKHKYGHYNL